MRLNQSAFLLFFLEICSTPTRLDSICPLLEKLMNQVIVVSCALCLFFSPALFAIETSEAVKVTPVLKTSQSWDGALLKYPQGQAEITGVTPVLELLGKRRHGRCKSQVAAPVSSPRGRPRAFRSGKTAGAGGWKWWPNPPPRITAACR